MSEPTIDEARCSFRFEHYRRILQVGRDAGYRFKTCREYCTAPNDEPLICVLRHDLDTSPERAIEFARAEHEMGISATYFVRVHANEYNPLSYEVLALVRDLDAMGHEIGLHAEPLDVARAIGLDPTTSVRMSAEVLRLMLGHPFEGVASHNDWTPDNNLDFFADHPADSLGLLYEAYDDRRLNLFPNSHYLTDSHFWYWRTFENGRLTDRRTCLCDSLAARHPRVYALTHPHAWYRSHYHRVRY